MSDECSKCGKTNWFTTSEGNVCRTEDCGHRREDDDEFKNTRSYV